MIASRPLDELLGLARRIRGWLVQLSYQAAVPHLASSLSCVDILVAAYWGVLDVDHVLPLHPSRDRFILSKGHAATTLYTALALRGFFPEELLNSFAKAGSRLSEHPSPGCVPGVEVATGSLGHGLSIGAGMALAGRIQQCEHRTIVVMSDGECNEGSVWEAAMFAPAHRLDRLAVVIDYNKWQATGRSNEVMSLSPLRDKWEAFGWTAVEVDGHDIPSLISTLTQAPEGSGRPLAIVAHTVKGRGISFMEDDNNWHYRIPRSEEVSRALDELGLGTALPSA